MTWCVAIYLLLTILEAGRVQGFRMSPRSVAVSLVRPSSTILATVGWGSRSSRCSSSSSSSSGRRRSSRDSSSTALQFKTFDEMLAELDQPVLVDFYAQWCGPCRMMQPVLEDIAARMESDIKVAKVDTDRSPTLGNRYQVEALPTLILFSKGQVMERYVGYMTADELENAVRATLKRVKAST